MSTIQEYRKWKQKHPDEGYQYDMIHEFFAGLSRGEMYSLMELLLELQEQKENDKKRLF